MNALPILKKTLTLVTLKMHARRRTSLVLSLESLLMGANATVTNLGRGINSKAKEKHRIKRADRLLSNTHLQREAFSIYQSLAKFTIGKAMRPIILVDWSDLDEHKGHFLLRATLASHGRGICLYEEVHSVKTKEKPRTHQQFLTNLAKILADTSKPIIVTDAGFKTPWFRAVLAHGWDFVGRVRLPNFYSIDDKVWQCITHLYAKATGCPKSFNGAIARSNQLACRLLLYKQKSKGRQSLNHSGKKRLSKTNKVYRKSANDPWLLATSLPQTKQLARRTTRIYGLRMEIEEGFRDMKSHQFGQGFEYNRTYNTNRLAILILLTTLAHWLLMAIGLAAKKAYKHHQYQANSLKNKNVLSLHFIGLRVMANRYEKLSYLELLTAIKQLHLTGGAHSFDTL
ncbi:IS4 family transposase [Thalassotalea hakodatensis]|uniref:IS4 family transposase n=1 Tax=Thalassotalea hakodatensis TaxID=3030492 RepID=UPI0025746A8F|nr:IS4 family transposase [Thalassotalea hakodatensis]